MDATTRPDRLDQLTGVLLGTAVGDALGLPREGLTPWRAARLYGTSPLRHRFVLGRGMVSDDAEHACMTAQALLAAPDDDARFARSLAMRLRGWFVALPAAMGWATLRAIVKLWLGFPADRSGVFSAGNGPAMRAPVIGACLAATPARIAPAVRASTRLTHTDPRAEEGALVIALAAAHGVTRGPHGVDAPALLDELRRHVTGDELRRALDQVADHLARGASATDLVAALGLERGVTGYMLHTVPAALFCWLQSPGDVARSVEEIILLGGDADSTGAIVGGLAGATAGASAIPPAWLDGICDYPRSISWMRRLGARLAARFGGASAAVSALEPGDRLGPLPLFWPAIFPRNAVFLALALAHGFRRMFPPY
ncbi:ADP-ribosylglycohydrolase family protein [Chondromyces apiculatus]|nr:ADP-ribosylglycohydrolase family protein [Chondromyces apiculatus]